MRNSYYVLLFVLCTKQVFGQDRDLVTSTYTFVPSRLNQVDFNQSRTQVNFPVKTKIGMFTNNFQFDYYRLNYDSNLFAYTESLQRMYALNYRINYTRSISESWNLGMGFLVGTQSNFQAQLSSEDFNLGGSLFFIKSSSKEQSHSRLVIGVNFSNALGEPRLLPMIGYTKIYTNGNAFAVGFPNTFYKYQLNAMNSVRALVDFQAFYMNIGDRPQFGNDQTISKASFLSAAMGLEFKHNVDENWAVLLKSSYSFLNDYTLQNENENEIFDFDLSQVMYFTLGITFNIHKSKIKDHEN